MNSVAKTYFLHVVEFNVNLERKFKHGEGIHLSPRSTGVKPIEKDFCETRV